MTELVEMIAKSLVDAPDEVNVSASEDKQTTVIQLQVAPSRFFL